MKKIETDTVQREDLNFDNMSLGDYEKSTGVTLPEVQDNKWQKLSLKMP
jgi:hypothetical protein